MYKHRCMPASLRVKWEPGATVRVWVRGLNSGGFLYFSTWLQLLNSVRVAAYTSDSSSTCPKWLITKRYWVGTSLYVEWNLINIYPLLKIPIWGCVLAIEHCLGGTQPENMAYNCLELQIDFLHLHKILSLELVMPLTTYTPIPLVTVHLFFSKFM